MGAAAPKNDWGLPSINSLLESDDELRHIPEDARKRYMAPKGDDAVERTRKALEANGHDVYVVGDRHAALSLLNSLVPKGVDVTSVGSTTLREIGYIDASTSGKTPGIDIRGLLVANKDHSKDRELRARRNTAAFSFGSVAAVSETGELVIVDASGTRVGPMLVTDKAILVVGSNKIEPTYQDALKRTREWAYTSESARCRRVYKNQGSSMNNLLVIRRQMVDKRIIVILVKEALGY